MRYDFYDCHGEACSLQTAYEPLIYIGVNRAPVKIRWKDAIALKMRGIKKDNPETNEYGWCSIKIPEEAFVFSRMCLTQNQAREIGTMLLRFADTGMLYEEK